MIKILLINPPQHTRYPQPPLGLAYIAAVLEKNGYSVNIIDMPALNLSSDSIPEIIKDVHPDIVGLTAMTSTITSALGVASRIKHTNKEIIIVLGGPHVSVLPEETLRNYPYIDIIIRGEGEQTFLDFVNSVQNGYNFAGIDGLTFRSDDNVISNPDRAFISCLDELPFPAFNLIPMQKYRLHPPFGRRTPTMPIITSRGCPYRCSFCSKSVFGRSHRVNSASYVVDEIKLLVDKFGIKEIKFYDDSFTLNRKRVIEICSLLKKRKLDVQWSCETRVNLVDRGLLSTMENAGCYMIEYGVESGVQKILDNLKKDTSLKQIRDAFRLSHESGIETVAYFMLGSPNETPETIEQTIAFAKNIDPDFAQFSIATPFPGTELYKYAMEANQLPENWMGYVYADLTSISNPAFSSQLLSRSELGNWNRRAYLNFYLRGKYILKRLKKIKNAQDFRTSVIGLRMLLESVV